MRTKEKKKPKVKLIERSESEKESGPESSRLSCHAMVEHYETLIVFSLSSWNFEGAWCVCMSVFFKYLLYEF